MTPLAQIDRLLCAASTARLGEPWEPYDVDDRRVFEGDVVLVEALASQGAYVQVENTAGRSISLRTGDRFLGVIANRESLSYLNGAAPETGLDPHDDAFHLLSNGGLVGTYLDGPLGLGPPLPLQCHGVLVLKGSVVNTLRRPLPTVSAPMSPIVLVAASVTDSGKTTLASNLIHLLVREYGLAVAACKLAGTGCLEDILVLQDAGAQWTADFPDVGLPSTYTSPNNYRPAIRSLLASLSARGPHVIVAELGGDLLWANIPTLLTMPEIMDSVLMLVVLPGDVLAAIGASTLLQEWNVRVPTIWVTPVNRNHTSFSLRMHRYVNGQHLDGRRPGTAATLAAEIANQLSVRDERRVREVEDR